MTYDNYDYEEAYQKQLETLEEFEIERLVKEKKLDGVYRTTTTKAGDQIEVDIYPSFNKRSDVPKTKRKRETKPSQRNLNDKRARRYFNNLVSANFNKKDLWGTFGYNDENLPASIEEAQRIFKNFIRRINTKRKKAGKGNLRYIYVTEFNDQGEKIRVHHHIIFSGDCDRDEIEGMWKHGDRPETKRLTLDKQGSHLAGLVTYITKDPRGTKRWTPSMGLNKPEVSRSYSKFKKGNVNKMAKDHEYLEAQLTKKYPGYKFIDAQVKYNDITSAFYIYARLCRD